VAVAGVDSKEEVVDLEEAPAEEVVGAGLAAAHPVVGLAVVVRLLMLEATITRIFNNGRCSIHLILMVPDGFDRLCNANMCPQEQSKITFIGDIWLAGSEEYVILLTHCYLNVSKCFFPVNRNLMGLFSIVVLINLP